MGNGEVNDGLHLWDYHKPLALSQTNLGLFLAYLGIPGTLLLMRPYL